MKRIIPLLVALALPLTSVPPAISAPAEVILASAANTAPRPEAPPMPYMAAVLKYENFDAGYLIGQTNSDQLALGPFILGGSFSGYGLRRSPPGPLTPYLIYGVDEMGNRNLESGNGAIQFYFTPDFSSGTGPGTYVRLAELAAIGDRNQSIVLFSLQVTPDGSALSLVADSANGPIELIHAPINWAACAAQLVALNFGTNGTQLFLNGRSVAQGAGTLALPADVLELALGSGLEGANPCAGTVDEFYSLAKPRRQSVALTEAEVSFYFQGTSNNAALGPMSDAQAAAWAARLAARHQPAATAQKSKGGGKPSLKPSGGGLFNLKDYSGGGGCVTGGYPYLTNVIAEPCDTNMCVGLTVAGGTNGVAYLLYKSTNAAAAFLSPTWQFVQFLHACDWVYLTNGTLGTCFFRLSTVAKSSVNDGIPDWWKVQHGFDPADPTVAWADPDHDLVPNLTEYTLGLDPWNPDSDYDSIPEGREYYFDGTDPASAESRSAILLGSWRFDTTNWAGLQGQLPLNSSTNLALVSGLSGNAVSINSTNPVWLIYRDYETNSLYGNINLRKGSLRVWLKPAWNSTGTNSGAGPGNEAPIISVGTKATAWWALALDAKGTNLSFFTPTNSTGGYKANASAAVKWTTNDWVQIVCVWSPTNSAIFINGQPANTNGSGVSLWPDASIRAQGWRVGSDGNTNQIRARLDNLQSFNYMLTATEIAANYSAPCTGTIDAMLVIDRSGSMDETMSDGIKKMAAANQAASNFVQHLSFSRDQAGIVTFWNTASLAHNLSSDGTDLLSTIGGITAAVGTAGTRIDMGITNAQGELLNSGRHDPGALPVMVVLTDGRNDADTRSNVFTAASSAVSAGIRIITIGLGKDADTNLLQAIAATNDYYFATNSSQLDQAYSSIANSLCRLTNLPPTVTITKPTNSQTFTYPASIRIDATASDPEDALVGVEFFSGTNFLGADYHAPFSIIWGGAAHGTNTLTAVAWDESNLSTTSTPVNIIIVGAVPTIQITSPAAGQTIVTSPTNLLITGSASVAGGTITNVSLSANGSPLGSVPNLQPATFNFQRLWTNIIANTYTLTAIAADNRGATATNSISLTVNAMPVVTILAPTNIQSYIEGADVQFHAVATDPDGNNTITNVTLRFSDGWSGRATNDWTITNYFLIRPGLAHGTYPVTATAADNRGATNHSGLCVFRVTQTGNPPSVQITFPTSNMVFNAGADITITATATNFPASVTNVEFFANRVLLGSDTESPYAITECCWKPGSYALTAKATDSSGSSTVSTQVNITVIDSIPLGPGFWDPTFVLPATDECGIAGLWNEFGVQTTSVDGTNFYFTANDYEGASSLWRWDGAGWFRWEGLAGYLSGDNCQAFPFFYDEQAVVKNSLIYVAGSVTNEPGYGVQRYDGTNWTLLGGTFLVEPGDFRYQGAPSITPRPQFLGSDLYIYGNFTAVYTNEVVYTNSAWQTNLVANTNIQYLARWDAPNSTWAAVGTPLNGPVLALASLAGHPVIGGLFTGAGGNTNANHVAELISGSWTNLGTGVSGMDYNYYDSLSPGDYPPVESGVFSLAACGNQLFVGGDFLTAGDVTNANGIAVWNGRQWQPLGSGLGMAYSGLTGDYSSINGYTNPIVYAIAAHGNDIFVGGQFAFAFNGTGEAVPAANIAKATWHEDQQQWTWSDLDYGLFTSCGSDIPRGQVVALSIMDGPTNGVYDLFAGGYFGHAGSNNLANCNSDPFLNCIARWRVGYPRPEALPTVAITSPTNLTVYPDSPDDINITVAATAATTNYIARVDFYADGNRIGTDYAPGTNSAAYDWPAPPFGVHILEAVARDSAGLQRKSDPILTSIKNSTNPITAHDDVYTINEGSPPIALLVLTNDVSTNGPLRVSRVITLDHSLASAYRGHDGTYISYTPFAYAFGTNRFFYTVTNAAGDSDSAWVTVNTRAKPVIKLDQPANGARLGFSTNYASSWPISGRALDYDGIVTNVAIYLNNALWYHTNNPVFDLAWTTNVPDSYVFTIVATDNDGLTGQIWFRVSVYDADFTSGLTASIDNLPSSVSSLNGLTVTNFTTVRDGLFDLSGQARGANTNYPITYELLLYQPSAPNSPFANVTPQPRDIAGFHHGGDTNGALGRLDFSTIPNGTYDLALTVHSGGGDATATARFRLESQLKIGQFSFSEQDLVLPVNGIPLTVTRTYNSLNPRTADFGYSWSYALNAMDVQLDEERQDIEIGGNTANTADDDEDATGPNRIVSVRSGGGWDVTLTLPDGRRATFAFTPRMAPSECKAYAEWTGPPDVQATLVALPGHDVIDLVPFLPAAWHDGGDGSTLDNHDIPGWILQTQDGTKFYITRGPPDLVTYDTSGDGSGTFINANVYDAQPKLTSIVQRTGDRVEITDTSIAHYNPTNALTRSTFFTRDLQGRIIEIRDPISGSNGLALVKYVYHVDTGNLLQVLKLQDRSAGTYLTTKYHYDNPNFPHFITSVEDPRGVPLARNEYDDDGRLTAVVDADGNRTEFRHDTTNRVELVIDRLGHTNSHAYDLRGNVTATTNAVGGITLAAYDDLNNKTNEIQFLNGQPYATNRYVFDSNSLLLASINPLGFTNSFTYNTNCQVLTTTDARGYTSTNVYNDSSGNLMSSSDALGNTTTYSYNDRGLMKSSADPLGTVTANYYDDAGNLTATAVATYQYSTGSSPTNLPTVTILSTNSFTYDENGNRITSTIWRRISGVSTGATTTCNYDAQNRVIQAIDALGFTNTTVFNEIGQQSQAIDKLGHVTSFDYDFQGRSVKTTYPDLTTESWAFDANGNRISSTDRTNRTTLYIPDALGRVTQTVFPDGTSSRSIFDDLGRTEFTVDARGTTNAFGYNAAGQQIASTNALGLAEQLVTTSAFDANGNQITQTDASGHTTTNIFDPLNRLAQVQYPDGTKTSIGFDSAGRRIAQTNQDGIITLFGLDGLGQLLSVTSAYGTTNQTLTRYVMDEAGNQTAQIDANNHTNTFGYSLLGQRLWHKMPDGTNVEWFAYDPAGNQVYQTNFNGVVVMIEFDIMNRLTNISSVNGFHIAYTYTPTSQRETMTDASGTTSYQYNSRDWLTNKTVAWSAGPTISLNYAIDANGNVTNIWSSSTNGVNLQYALDPLNRITNVIANGASAANYSFDAAGNRRSVRLGNGVTNLCQFDPMNRLTNMVWKLNGTPLASFAYQLGATGARTNLAETVNGTNRTYAWNFDRLYRLRTETISGLGTVSYGLDLVGNRLTRTSSVPVLTNQTFAFSADDRLGGDSYDNNGNTTNSAGNSFAYDPDNRVIAAAVGGANIALAYDGDGNRASKTVIAGGTTNTEFYLIDDRNPSGYAQVLEEWTASSGATSLSHVCNYGIQLISERQPNVSTNFFVFDGHGSTRALADIAGNIVNAFTFDAFGNLIASNAPSQTSYLYCGEQWDSHLGQDYLRLRTFNPNTGRFQTRDAIEGHNERPASLHKYLYCEAEPVNNADPSGQELVGELMVLDGLGNLFSPIAAAITRLGAQRVTISIITEIRPPDAQSGVKTRHVVALDGFGRIFRTNTITGTTDLVIAAPTGGANYRQRVTGSFGHYTVSMAVTAHSAALPSKFDIDYNLDTTLDFFTRKGTLKGVHDQYPSHKVNINGKTILDFPQRGSPLNLWGPGNITENVNFNF